MNRLGSLITQLESTEKYDKENVLIDIYIYLQEPSGLIGERIYAVDRNNQNTISRR